MAEHLVPYLSTMLYTAVHKILGALQGGVSEGILTPVDLSQEAAPDERAQSGTGAITSGRALWGEDMQVWLSAATF